MTPDENAELRARGIGREKDDERTLFVFFNRRPTDDEMRRVHDVLGDPVTLASRALPAAPDVGEDALVREIGGMLMGRVNAPEGAIYQAAREIVGITSASIRDQAKREAYAECIEIARGYGPCDWHCNKSIAFAIEALAEKKP